MKEGVPEKTSLVVMSINKVRGLLRVVSLNKRLLVYS